MRVLIVHQVEEERSALASVFRVAGWETVEARTVGEGLIKQWAHEQGELHISPWGSHRVRKPIDLLITASGLPPVSRTEPGLEGVALCRFARLTRPDLPCIVWTRFWDPVAVHTAASVANTVLTERVSIDSIPVIADLVVDGTIRSSFPEVVV